MHSGKNPALIQQIVNATDQILTGNLQILTGNQTSSSAFYFWLSDLSLDSSRAVKKSQKQWSDWICLAREEDNSYCWTVQLLFDYSGYKWNTFHNWIAKLNWNVTKVQSMEVFFLKSLWTLLEGWNFQPNGKISPSPITKFGKNSVADKMQSESKNSEIWRTLIRVHKCTYHTQKMAYSISRLVNFWAS